VAARFSPPARSLKGIKRLPCRLTDDCTGDSYYLETAASRKTAAGMERPIQLSALRLATSLPPLCDTGRSSFARDVLTPLLPHCGAG